MAILITVSLHPHLLALVKTEGPPRSKRPLQQNTGEVQIIPSAFSSRGLGAQVSEPGCTWSSSHAARDRNFFSQQHRNSPVKGRACSSRPLLGYEVRQQGAQRDTKHTGETGSVNPTLLVYAQPKIQT